MKLVFLVRILCLCLPVFFLQNNKVSGQCRDQEQEALLDLKNGFRNFSPHSGITTWQPDIDCCKWEGVVCDKHTGKVASLDISHSSIEGDGVSSRIFALEDLEVLNLAYNHFNSSIPSGLDRFSKLTHLNLSNSGFAGQIPLEISRMTSLVSLDLSFNNREDFLYYLKLGNPDLSTLINDLINLKHLHLGGRQMDCKVPISLNKLSSLESLNLSDCGLLDDFPEEVFSLKNLTYLDISDNTNLKVVIPELPETSVLRSLKLSSTNLYGMSVASLRKLYTLTRLDISHCYISEHLPLPHWISTLRNLVYLDLSYNNFNGSILSLQNLTELVHLDLSYNKFQSGLRHLKKLSQLSYMDLSKNKFNEDSSTFMRELGNLTNLTHLNLFMNDFTGKISFIDNLTSLTFLDISYNSFSGSIPKMENHQELLVIDMSGNNFNGSMPSFSSKNLEEIDFSYNRLGGKIPQSYGNFSNLHSLGASENEIEGPLPLSLFYLPSLEELFLKTNNLNIIPNDINMNVTSSKLTDLYLGSNHLSGPIPKWIFQLKNLQRLYLENNNFSGTLDLQLFSNLQNLIGLRLSDNNLLLVNSSSNFTFHYFPKVMFLTLSNCRLTEFPNFLRSNERLHNLDLSQNNIGGKIPNWIWRNGMDTLNLSYNLLEGFEEPHDNISLKSFLSLDLSNNRFSGKISNIFGSNWVSAMYISLANNSFFGKIPKTICNASNLEMFDLSYNELSGTIPQCIGELGWRFVILNLEHNNFSGKMPQSYGKDCGLIELNLNENLLDGDIPRSLENCRNLEVLDLGNNQLSGTFPFWLGSLNFLRVLMIRSNRLYGEINNSNINCSFPSLQIMDISSNNFTGTISLNCLKSWKTLSTNDNKNNIIDVTMINSYKRQSVTLVTKGEQRVIDKILYVFTSIDISNNNFGGEIPKDIGELTSLRFLNISRNHLIGPIPPSIGNLTLLESLDLSINNLSGNIPLELTSLTFLSTLNLSINNFEGRIPQGNQFSTFNELSFLGNPKLCGQPLEICYEDSPSSVSLGKESSTSFIETNWLTFSFGFVSGLIISVVFENIVSKRRLKAQVR